jgi:HEAT repeat protein
MSFKNLVTFAIAIASSAPAFAQGMGPLGPGPSGAGPMHLLGPGVGRSLLEPLPGFGQGFGEQEKEERERERKEREADRQRMARERQADMYDSGMDATYEGRYDKALAVFSRLAHEKGPRADAALYWKAYSLNKLGRRPDALAAIGELTKAYPNSRYVRDAKALEVEVRNASGQAVAPGTQDEEDLKLLAINSMQHSAPEQAVPLLEQVLQGTASPRVKARALFVLALSDSPRAREVLTNIAKGKSTPDLQSRAIQYLGVHGGSESRAALAEVYASSNDVDIKRRILRAFMVSGEKARLFTAAQSEKDPELRSTAVEQLGIMGAHDELWQLYQKETSVDVKRQIIRAMFVGGNATRLIELARTEQNPELRLTAVRNLGIMGSKETGEALITLYNDTDPEVKKAVVHSLFVQGNAAGLVALARKEKNVNMKKTLVERLSLMDDKIARDYMLELLK